MDTNRVFGLEESVAAFCSTCGASISPTAQFCSACGAPEAVPELPSRVQADRRVGAYLALAAAAAMAIGSFMPWGKATLPFVGTITRSGMEGGDGWFFLGMAAVCTVIGFRELTGSVVSSARGMLMVLGLIAAGLAVFEASDISNRFSEAKALMDADGAIFGTRPSDMVSTSLGAGLALLGVGAVLAFVAGAKLEKD